MTTYNPVPTRVWSRTQGICSFIDPVVTYRSAFTNEPISKQQYDLEMQQLYKGNVLQYRKNSMTFTKTQRYSQIAKGKLGYIDINKCNNRTITSPTICSPASASNVPGNGFLCWNNNFRTFFPRQKYTNSNSGTKFPQGYKGFVSAVTCLTTN
jgi:hypothetical protein